MSLHLLSLFVAAVFLLSGTPGPNMLHILARSVALGVRRALIAMAGVLLALIAVLAASAAGLSAVLMALPGAFEILRFVGVAYLVHLGIRSWRGGTVAIASDAAPAPAPTSRKIFAGGFFVCASNPKLLLFATAFLPQFVDPAEPAAMQFAILVATFAAIELFWMLVYALGGKGLARHLGSPRLRTAFNRVTGGVFVAFGALLLRLKPVV
ncbi:LysE type translocator family protein [uncultured Alphaproteobacteria bacterium]|uniref:LysE type translocator family protein n=1 Tax=uncultured Alphaproteobacteria bacterium TaxID=91750 RepID=A0A212KHQ3_9PROT|nr:LysE type translocator family protein [uncultured Alphaproteobacteria bacterium]